MGKTATIMPIKPIYSSYLFSSFLCTKRSQLCSKLAITVQPVHIFSFFFLVILSS